MEFAEGAGERVIIAEVCWGSVTDLAYPCLDIRESALLAEDIGSLTLLFGSRLISESLLLLLHLCHGVSNALLLRPNGLGGASRLMQLLLEEVDLLRESCVVFKPLF